MGEEQIAALARDIHHIRASQESMRAAIERMSEAVTRLAIVEERQSAASQAIDRVISCVEKIDERVRALETADPVQSMATDWVTRAMLAAAAAAVIFAATKVGLL